MRFPGKRKSKHYFPVENRGRIPFSYDFSRKGNIYMVGIDQILVDIEASVDEDYLKKVGFCKGESILLSDEQGEKILKDLRAAKRVSGQYAGGAIGNTLHNFSVLSEGESVLLGTISQNITVGDNAFHYICNTSSLVDLSYLQPTQGPMGQAICLITPDGERSFGICKGQVNELREEFIPEEILPGAAALLISAYLLRDRQAPLYTATMKAVSSAKKNGIPVVMSLGTSRLVEENRSFLEEFICENVNVVAGNQDEVYALTQVQDPLLAGETALNWTDLVLLTVGVQGLYLCGYVDKSRARETHDFLHTTSLVNYNKFEYSRAMLKKDCLEPIRIYTHIDPYMGGPGVVTSTNGAGDAACAALLHDLAANHYHREMVPASPKHSANYLTYSSLSQICKYANRVSFEVLKQKSPRLLRCLPEREDSLEESYWEK